MAIASLNEQNAYIWRIIHRDNLPWILDNGLHCGNSTVQSPNWVHIGNADLIEKRNLRSVTRPPHGTLNDYIPFYFTPFSPMMYNIHTGRGGVQQRPNEDIIILVSSLHQVQQLQHPFLFTDRHANIQYANFFNNLADLNKIDWLLIQRRDFQRDYNDPTKLERYQAEALIFQYFPATALRQVICYNDSIKQQIEQQAQARGLTLGVHVMKGWYF